MIRPSRIHGAHFHLWHLSVPVLGPFLQGHSQTERPPTASEQGGHWEHWASLLTPWSGLRYFNLLPHHRNLSKIFLHFKTFFLPDVLIVAGVMVYSCNEVLLNTYQVPKIGSSSGNKNITIYFSYLPSSNSLFSKVDRQRDWRSHYFTVRLLTDFQRNGFIKEFSLISNPSSSSAYTYNYSSNRKWNSFYLEISF